MAHQVTVFAENKPGRLGRITRILADAGTNIRAFTIADSGDFGVLKFVVDCPEAAHNALSDAGLVARRREILAIEMEDRPGGLSRIAQLLEEQGINILDATAFLSGAEGKAVLLLETERIPEAERVVAQAGLRTLSDEEIYSL